MTQSDARTATSDAHSDAPATQPGGQAGRGLVLISTAKLYFIVSGYAVQLVLPRLLGSPEAFGLFSLALSQVSILNNVLIAATVQTVSKHVSQDLGNAGATLRQALLLQLGLGSLLAASLWTAAPVLAGRWLLDPMLVPLLRVSASVVFCYALYAALIGSLNGRQQFGGQAVLDMSYTTLRLLGMLGAAALGFGALGAMVGLAAGVAAVLALALLRVGIGQAGRRWPWQPWLSFMAPLWLYQLCLSLVLQVDLSVLKGTVAALGMDAGLTQQAAAETASRMAGFYRAAQTFAFVPYQLILSVTFVVFPMISLAQSSGDREASRRYVQHALRFSLLVLLAIAAPVSGAASGVMRIAYPDAYLAGADALAILAPGMVCFGLFVIGATILSGAGRPAIAALIALASVALVMGCDVLFVRLAGIGGATLQAAAAGTSLGMACALVAMAFAVYRVFSSFIPWLSTIRMLIAAAVAWLVAHTLPNHNAALSVCALVAGSLSFIAMLWVSGEIDADDVRQLRTLGKYRRAGHPPKT